MGAAARWAMEATPAEEALGTEDAGAAKEKEVTAGMAGVAELAIEWVAVKRAVKRARGCRTQ